FSMERGQPHVGHVADATLTGIAATALRRADRACRLLTAATMNPAGRYLMRCGGVVLASVIGLVLAAGVARAEEVSCAEQGGVEAEQAYQHCIGEGGSEADCKDAAAQTFQSCTENNCANQPQDCQAKCEDVATHVQNECLEKCTEGDCASICQQAH